MPQKPPPFAQGRRWVAAASRVKGLNRRLWRDLVSGWEYEPDPRKNGNWHEINPLTAEYRDIDPESGQPIAGSEGQWRKLS